MDFVLKIGFDFGGNGEGIGNQACKFNALRSSHIKDKLQSCDGYIL